jgi:hypothetical protein
MPAPLLDTGYWILDSLLPLLLLVLRVGADDPHDSLAADDLAILADPPDAASNLHGDKPFQPVRTGESTIISGKSPLLKGMIRSHPPESAGIGGTDACVTG